MNRVSLTARGKSPPRLFAGGRTAGFHGSCAAAIASLRSSRLFCDSLLPLFVGVCGVCGLLVAPLAAAEPPPAVSIPPNAAVIHWQAFALMPQLPADPLKETYDAAVAAPTAPVPPDLEPVIDGFRLALGELHRAARVPACDWNPDYESGLDCTLPHLEKARTLSKAALLRARMRFAKGQTADAIADVMAVLKLARDCGRSPLLVSLLVCGAIEKSAGDVLAANLGRLSREQLDGIAAAIDGLPPATPLAACLELEGRMFGGWFSRVIDAAAADGDDPRAAGRVVARLLEPSGSAADTEATRRRQSPLESLSTDDLRESLRLLREDYDRAAAIAALPPDERPGKLAEFHAAIGRQAAADAPERSRRILSSLALPDVAKVGEKADDADARRRLLAAAIDVRRRGADAVRGAMIPGRGPIEYRPRESGFELRTGPAGKGEPVGIVVGP